MYVRVKKMLGNIFRNKKYNHENIMAINVIEAYSSQVGKNLVYIDKDCMKKINIKEGEILEITGLRKAYPICMCLYKNDEARGIIRIDGNLRNIIGVNVGDTIVMRKADSHVKH